MDGARRATWVTENLTQKARVAQRRKHLFCHALLMVETVVIYFMQGEETPKD